MKNIEVLEPYQNEVLYSWLSRMFNWYGYHNQPKSDTRKFNIILFGKNSRSLNNILILHDLQKLIEKVNLSDSEYFKTAKSLIKRTTIIPFYIAFINEAEQVKVYDNLIHDGQISIIKSRIQMFSLYTEQMF